ncbi:MAG: phage tail protein [Bacteroidota bacterium]
MKTFSLICEGVTDQIVLKNILIGYFNDIEEDKISFTYAQPQQDETGRNATKQIGGGGWGKVLQYIASDDLKNREPYTDYFIIQIDSDRAHDFPIDLSGQENVEESISKIRTKLIQQIGKEFYEKIKEKTFFAICVDSLECWLLPLYYSNDRKADTNNCIYKLNQKLHKKLIINPINKDGRVYRKISKDYLKNKTITEKYGDNPSFEIFINSMNEVFQPKS